MVSLVVCGVKGSQTRSPDVTKNNRHTRYGIPADVEVARGAGLEAEVAPVGAVGADSSPQLGEELDGGGLGLKASWEFGGWRVEGQVWKGNRGESDWGWMGGSGPLEKHMRGVLVFCCCF